MSQINLLVIEDEAAQIQVYEDVIAQYNKKNTPQFQYTICKKIMSISSYIILF